MATQCSPGWSLSCVLHTKADGYVKTTSGRVSLAPLRSDTSAGPVPEVVIYGRSPSVVVDDIATFVDLEHGLEFTVDDYVHGMFQCGCKVHLDAEITLSCQMKTTTVATVGG